MVYITQDASEKVQLAVIIKNHHICILLIHIYINQHG